MRRDRERGCDFRRGAVDVRSLDKESGEIIQLARILNELALALLEIVAHNRVPCRAKILGISRRALQRKTKKYHIS